MICLNLKSFKGCHHGYILTKTIQFVQNNDGLSERKPAGTCNEVPFNNAFLPYKCYAESE